jgi:hypothetical protein
LLVVVELVLLTTQLEWVQPVAVRAQPRVLLHKQQTQWQTLEAVAVALQVQILLATAVLVLW